MPFPFEEAWLTPSPLSITTLFSKRDSAGRIISEMRPRLWDYMGGIARENRLRALTINGMADHAHMLISLNPAIALADAIKEIKAGSSAWMSSTIGKDFSPLRQIRR